MGSKSIPSILVLSDGSHFLGEHFGEERESIGELVFNTSMTGYQEALTDPSYAGQVLTFCYPLQGNYGINAEDWESGKVHVRAVVAREVCAGNGYSHYKAEKNLSECLQSFGVPGISGVDTRAIARRVRERGVMPAAVSPLWNAITEKELAEKITALGEKIAKYDYGKINFVEEVSLKQKKIFSPKKPAARIALIDCGVKMSIIRELLARGAEVAAFPFDVKAETIRKDNFDGLVISNGPGDPALMRETISTAQNLLGKLPILGICLGHQLLAHALGGSTYKLKFGHRGSNHAVLQPDTGKIYITTQNHGYAAKGVPAKIVDELFVNCNDRTNEGLRHRGLPVISTQFHPEGACGPKDANFVFEEFMKMLK